MATKKHKISPGAKIAREMRSEANKLTDEQRDNAMSVAMQAIYGNAKKTAVHAVRD